MKPDWDKLMKEFEGSSSVLVADVDCTAGGQGKCQEVGVRGYPTIKYGDPNDLQDYNGGRSFAELQKFAQSLGPTCGPANLDLCDNKKKKLIDEYMALDSTKRESMIKEKEAEIEKLEAFARSGRQLIVLFLHFSLKMFRQQHMVLCILFLLWTIV